MPVDNHVQNWAQLVTTRVPHANPQLCLDLSPLRPTVVPSNDSISHCALSVTTASRTARFIHRLSPLVHTQRDLSNQIGNAQ